MKNVIRLAFKHLIWHLSNQKQVSKWIIDYHWRKQKPNSMKCVRKQKIRRLFSLLFNDCLSGMRHIVCYPRPASNNSVILYIYKHDKKSDPILHVAAEMFQTEKVHIFFFFWNVVFHKLKINQIIELLMAELFIFSLCCK